MKGFHSLHYNRPFITNLIDQEGTKQDFHNTQRQNCQSRVLYPVQLSFRYEKKNKSILIQNPVEYITTRIIIKEIMKDVLQSWREETLMIKMKMSKKYKIH